MKPPRWLSIVVVLLSSACGVADDALDDDDVSTTSQALVFNQISVGRPVIGPITAILQADNTPAIFIPTDYYVIRMHYDGAWNWSSITSPAQTVAAARNADGRIELALNYGNSLYTYRETGQNSGSFLAGYPLGQSLGDPAFGVNQDGRLELFAVQSWDGALHQRWETSPTGAWSSQYILSWFYNFTSRAATATDAWGFQHAYLISGNNCSLDHYTQQYVNSSWYTPNQLLYLGYCLQGRPAASPAADGRFVRVVVRTGQNKLYTEQTYGQYLSGNSGYLPDVTVSGQVVAVGDPAIVRNADGKLEVFAIGGGYLWSIKEGAPNSGTWSPPQSIASVASGATAPSALRVADGRIEVYYAIGSNVYVLTQRTPGNWFY